MFSSKNPNLSPESGEKNILTYLIKEGLLSDEQAHIIKTEHRKNTHSLEHLLVKFAFITEKSLQQALSHFKEIRKVSLKDCVIDESILSLVPKEVAEKHKALPLYQNEQGYVVLAMADPDDITGYDAIRQYFRQPMTPALALESEIEEAIATYFHSKVTLSHLLDYAENQPQGGSLESLEKPITQIVNLLLNEALHQRASDIHLEPEHALVRVRYRIDGFLELKHVFHKDLWNALCVRIKVLASMNIAESRKPQDGRFSLNILGRSVDFRVAFHPTFHGENLCIRVLDKNHHSFSLEDMGFCPKNLCHVRQILQRPHGIFIVTGPTGSGKTTTLYGALNTLDTQAINVMTLEDPIEYPFPHIRQTEIQEGVITFPDGVRSILRQDPDVILIGELRDKETAHMALRAAMTGHQVLTTLHTNHALGALYRFLDFNISIPTLLGSLTGILAQRLVRVLCSACKAPYTSGKDEKDILGIPQGSPIYQSKGCSLCLFTGYKHRKAISEVIVMEEGLENLIFQGASPEAIKQYLREQSFQTLFHDGLQMIIKGDIDAKELIRVLGKPQKDQLPLNTHE